MSHTFSIANAKSLRFGELSRALGVGAWRFREGTPLPEGGGWPHGISHSYLDGVSTRPIETTYDGSTFEARILTCTDAATTAHACRLVALIAKQVGAKVGAEDSASALSVSDFERKYGAAWVADHTRRDFEIVRKMLERDERTVTLNGVNRELDFGVRAKATLPRSADAFVEDLSQRFRLINYPDKHDVFLAPVIVVEQPQTKRVVRIAMYAGSASLLPTRAGIVAMGPAEEMLHVPFSRFVELWAERGRYITETLFFVPGVEGGEASVLQARARPLVAKDHFEFGMSAEEYAQESRPMTDNTTEVTDEEAAETLERMPALVFMLVSAADGKIEITSGSLEPIAALDRAATVMEQKFPADMVAALKQLYFGIGISIAKANATGFFKKKMRDEEAKALAAIAKTLRVPMPEL